MSVTESSAWVKRFQDVIPWGSSTISKAPRLVPDEPAVIVRGKGCRVWDDRGREFIDYRNALGPVTLGYCFQAVDEAIRRQLDCGVIFGQPHPLECEVAEMLCDVIPCAEQARFLKTGGEAIAACIRLARHYTGRSHVIQIGYNGWLNSLASDGQILPGQTSSKAPAGVPQALSDLHHSCRWNDDDSVSALFDQFDNDVAAVVVAADYPDMEKGREFYPVLREQTRQNGAVLIFDEIVTGFRIAVGGVQEFFGVVPDLAVFAKGMANGMPLSAYVGKREFMQDFQNVIVSSTYGGETLSLAAAKATIRTYQNENVIEHLRRQGSKLVSGVNEVFERRSLPICFKGMPPCPMLTFAAETPEKNAALRNSFFRAAYRNGVSLYNVSYVNFSHRDEDLAETMERLDSTCKDVVSLLSNA